MLRLVVDVAEVCGSASSEDAAETMRYSRCLGCDHRFIVVAE
ncbi:MAG TPA: hypothetical protein VF669_13190 [Tepidisphaeraceae bacterium]